MKSSLISLALASSVAFSFPALAECTSMLTGSPICDDRIVSGSQLIHPKSDIFEPQVLIVPANGYEVQYTATFQYEQGRFKHSQEHINDALVDALTAEFSDVDLAHVDTKVAQAALVNSVAVAQRELYVNQVKYVSFTSVTDISVIARPN